MDVRGVHERVEPLADAPGRWDGCQPVEQVAWAGDPPAACRAASGHGDQALGFEPGEYLVRLPGRTVRRLRELRYRPVPLRLAEHYLDQADADNPNAGRRLDLGRAAPLARLDVKQQPRDIDMNGADRVGICAARVLQFAAHVRGESVGHDHAEPGFSRHRS